MDLKKEKMFARTFALRERKRRIHGYTPNMKEYDAVQCRILPISDGTSKKWKIACREFDSVKGIMQKIKTKNANNQMQTGFDSSYF